MEAESLAAINKPYLGAAWFQRLWADIEHQSGLFWTEGSRRVMIKYEAQETMYVACATFLAPILRDSHGGAMGSEVCQINIDVLAAH